MERASKKPHVDYEHIQLKRMGFTKRDLTEMAPQALEWLLERLRNNLPIVVKKRLGTPPPAPVFGSFMADPQANLHLVSLKQVMRFKICSFLCFWDLYWLASTCRLFYRWVHPILVTTSKQLLGPGATPLAYSYYVRYLTCRNFDRSRRDANQLLREQLDLKLSIIQRIHESWGVTGCRSRELLETALETHGTIEQAFMSGAGKLAYQTDFVAFKRRAFDSDIGTLLDWCRTVIGIRVYRWQIIDSWIFESALTCFCPTLYSEFHQILMDIQKRDAITRLTEFRDVPVLMRLVHVWLNLHAPVRERIARAMPILMYQQSDALHLIRRWFGHAVCQFAVLPMDSFLCALNIVCQPEKLTLLEEAAEQRPISHHLRCVWIGQTVIDVVLEEKKGIAHQCVCGEKDILFLPK